MSSNIKSIIFSKEIKGIPIFYFLLMAVLSTAIWLTGNIEKTGIVGSFAFMWTIGFLFFAIGEKLPIWREYVGGGMIMAFIGSSVMVYVGFIGENDVKSITSHVVDNNFLYFLLMSLIAASILSIPRAVLLRSLIAYVPMIVGSLFGAVFLGVLAGLMTGVEPLRIITHYVMPIMGGGNGAGAIPMAEIYADSTGLDKSEYYSYAISILTLANVIAVIYGAVLNKVGNRYPSLSGNGQLMVSQSDVPEEIPSEIESARGDENTMGALFILISLLLLCFVLYSVFPAIHVFAWAVVVVMALSFSNVVTDAQRRSIIIFSEWGMRVFLILVLVTVGLITDFSQLLDALTLGNFIISFFIVTGAVIGSGFVGKLMGCHVIESSICAGLCMANRGGSGDIEVLSAAKRMSLYPYAQVSSRIGGAIALTLAGYVFGNWV
tara:strand:- start:4238 stop:5539 length:1302 start_codon:yes stop_codon:yes gene_type:complete